jgi:hypothetical protein
VDGTGADGGGKHEHSGIFILADLAQEAIRITVAYNNEIFTIEA